MSDTVKLIIEIPKEAKQAFDKAQSNDLKGGYYDHSGIIGKAIQNGIPLDENKGEWILDETDNSVECNKCLCQIYPNDISYGEPHFCPNCGADMRGKAE